MTFLDPRFLLAALLALLAAYGAGYSKGGRDSAATQRQELQEWQLTAEAATELYLQVRDRKEARYRTITQTVEVAKNATPDIADCRTGDDWMRIYRDNAAIANGTAVPAGSGGADGADAR
ncbi:hypothetical protein HI806_09350 [Ralstonia solanacearum]|uniref:hypothetical protein n=1 Tax=Ralstonia pseudosolanacearum TaxID=1310165 RepID=UPI00083CD598|nr:hypothetical protein [Ralstonia pseudosolanacearum]AOE89643.1 hypothetical protein LBM341_01355 [Ralstonia solanacearum]APF86937.1 hypothetical protein BCR16_09025 [Ralstonia solanacearum FJAT-1458]AXW57441.1 hypothetical protein CJO93_08485 [Ralstonia solanacearum]MCK4164263.1 hypothetical protein [Ralstonia pseudosolanacearum]NKA12014.1 hypothetical protein [Ralstonia solanacearum]